MQVGFDDSLSRGWNRLVSQIEKHNVCLSPACIFSRQQVVSMHTCNHYHSTVGLPQWSRVACCVHGVLCGAGSEIAFSRKTQTCREVGVGGRVECQPQTTGCVVHLATLWQHIHLQIKMYLKIPDTPKILNMAEICLKYQNEITMNQAETSVSWGRALGQVNSFDSYCQAQYSISFKPKWYKHSFLSVDLLYWERE